MSKSRGNVVAPWDVIERHGADAFRWYYFTSKQPWDGYRFSVDTVGESVRQFMLQLWSTYRFFALYANVNGVTVEPSSAGALGDLDRWVLSRLQATVEVARERLDDYDTTSAGRAIADFVEDLSNWYVRRSRRRFWDGDEGAFFVLWRWLGGGARRLAPFVSFVTPANYHNPRRGGPPVHLFGYPAGAQA